MNDIKQAFSKSDSVKEIAAALAKVQGSIKPALKDANNPFFKSRYADLASVWDSCREPLSTNKLAVTQLPAESEAGRVALTTMLIHGSGEWIASTCSIKLAKDDPQAAGSALTYLRRYMLSAIVGIVADDDDDGNHASGRDNASGKMNGSHVPPPVANRMAAPPASNDNLKPETLAKLKNVLGMLKLEWTQATIERAGRAIGRQIAPTEKLEHLSEADGRKLLSKLLALVEHEAKQAVKLATVPPGDANEDVPI
jgi:hypothetical protein